MLILTRKLGESINIGDNIRVSILGVTGRQVRIGIEAPSDVIVHREEVYMRIQEENRKASKSLKKDLSSVMGMIKNKLRPRSKTENMNPNIEFTPDKKKSNGKNSNNRNKRQ